MVGILQCSSKTLITRDNWIASDISTHKSSKSSLHKEKSSVQKKGVDVVFARDWIETRFRGGGEGIRRFRFFLVELTLERRTGAVRSNETIHTAITARRQLDMVHSDRERIGNTMTTNLQKKAQWMRQRKNQFGYSIAATPDLERSYWFIFQEKLRNEIESRIIISQIMTRAAR